MKQPLVSIIMPVYMAEATIRKSLDSILAQTLDDWELVIVDDGSPDSSGSICDEYARNDTRITVIHQQNGGVSAARQAGLDVAKGEYVIHVDPDDWVEPQMLEELYKKAKTEDVDMVICDYYVNSSKGEIYTTQRPSDLSPTIVLDEMFHGLHGSLCNKLVKRICYTRYNIHFFENVNYCEDKLIFVQLLRHEEVKVYYLHQAFYHYVQYPTSITNRYTIETLNALIQFVSVLSTLLSENSQPIILSKEDTKKFAFRHSLISDKELDLFYPEIRTVHYDNVMLTLMYRLAFTGHHFFAKQLRKVYWLLHTHSGYCITT